MTDDRIDTADIDLGDHVPEADFLEQRTPLTAQVPNDPLIDHASASVPFGSPATLVDEADWLEQQTPLPDQDDDDYPYDPPATG